MKLLLAMFISPFWMAYKLIELLVGMFGVTWNLWKWYWRRGKKDKPTHGDASFATDKELKAAGHFEGQGFYACRTKSGKRVYSHYERTAVILAPPGAGKSQHLISHTRNVLRRPIERIPFMVLGDAANESFKATSDQALAAGVEIFKIDCVDPDAGTRYDILSDLDPSFHMRHVFSRQLNAICELMVPDDVGSRQPHFVKFSRLLLKCAITVNVKYEGNDKPICDIIDELIDDDSRDALLKRATVYGDKFLTSTLKTMKKMQDKPEGVSMISTALQKLESWSDDAIREVSRNGWDGKGKYHRGWKMRDMLSSQKPVWLYLRTGTQQMGGDYARIVYGNFVNTVSMMFDEGVTLNRDAEIIMDEAGLAGYCNAISHAYARLRKARIRIRLCFVGYNEFEKTYPDAETILNGSDLILMGTTNEMKLNRLASDLMGDKTIYSKSQSENDNGESRGRSEQAQKLQKPDEVRRRDQGKVLAILGKMTVDGDAVWRFNKKTGVPESL